MVKKRSLERDEKTNKERKWLKEGKKQEREMHVQRLQYYNCGQKKKKKLF